MLLFKWIYTYDTALRKVMPNIAIWALVLMQNGKLGYYIAVLLSFTEIMNLPWGIAVSEKKIFPLEYSVGKWYIWCLNANLGNYSCNVSKIILHLLWAYKHCKIRQSFKSGGYNSYMAWKRTPVQVWPNDKMLEHRTLYVEFIQKKTKQPHGPISFSMEKNPFWSPKTIGYFLYQQSKALSFININSQL